METKINSRYVVVFQGDVSEQDNKYVKLLNESGIQAKRIPVLSFKYVNQEKLRNRLLNVDYYGGIIFSSVRAVNAIASVLSSTDAVCLNIWKEKNNFSVGNATSDMALSVLNLRTYGSDSGMSENLCKHILEKYPLYKKPLLFPCSNIRKNTIPDTLSQHGIEIEEVVCYETVPNVNFKCIWENLIKEVGLPEILIFFSPSGVQNCYKIVKDSYSHISQPKFVAIGPSTEQTLLEVGIHPSKVAEKPNPECILNVIKSLLNI